MDQRALHRPARPGRDRGREERAPGHGTETWDVVIGDIFLTYRAGVGALYTREHFAAVHAALEPDGLFVQWLPMFDLSEEEFGIVARTMLDVFPQVTLWRRTVSPEFPVYALVAREAPGASPAGGAHLPARAS